MIIKTAEYLQSEADWRKCPAPDKPEYAFIGRSNVGKSSLINMLTNHKSLAKTSSQPGKTQTINHFIINKAWYLVDLPGYGFAKTSKTNREKWRKMISDYLLFRENLQLVFVLIDSRIEPQRIDIDFINNLGENGVPFAIIFTKTDKVSGGKAMSNMQKMKNALSETWEELPVMMPSSAVSGHGKEKILDFIEDINQQYSKSEK
ncbi:MAG: YihA family ribosome biogenesis GTP-binding protein [Bacteroidales bacterium]|nr:YihA family ribosome biogenesis GTP-binding protein [Bacteroidales bacterium]